MDKFGYVPKNFSYEKVTDINDKVKDIIDNNDWSNIKTLTIEEIYKLVHFLYILDFKDFDNLVNISHELYKVCPSKGWFLHSFFTNESMKELFDKEKSNEHHAKMVEDLMEELSEPELAVYIIRALACYEYHSRYNESIEYEEGFEYLSDVTMIDHIGKNVFNPIYNPIQWNHKLVSKENFWKKWDEFSRWLNDFPYDEYEDLIISGGGVVKCLCENMEYGNSDVDIFIYGNDEENKRKTVEKLMNYFKEKHPGTYFSVYRSVVTLINPNIERCLQIVVTNYEKGFDIIYDFDQTHLMNAIYKGKLYVTWESLYSLITGKSIITKNINPYRVYKTHNHGFTLFSEYPYMIIGLEDAFDIISKDIYREKHNLCIPKIISNLGSDSTYLLSLILKNKRQHISRHPDELIQYIKFKGLTRDIVMTYNGNNKVIDIGRISLLRRKPNFQIQLEPVKAIMLPGGVTYHKAYFVRPIIFSMDIENYTIYTNFNTGSDNVSLKVTLKSERMLPMLKKINKRIMSIIKQYTWDNRDNIRGLRIRNIQQVDSYLHSRVTPEYVDNITGQLITGNSLNIRYRKSEFELVGIDPKVILDTKVITVSVREVVYVPNGAYVHVYIEAPKKYKSLAVK